MVGLHKALVVIGLEPDHQLTEGDNFRHVIFLLKIFYDRRTAVPRFFPVTLYFNEKGASQRGSVCIYDRAHSAIQEASAADFDWDAIFEGVDWFHFTGITPAPGPAFPPRRQ